MKLLIKQLIQPIADLAIGTVGLHHVPGHQHQNHNQHQEHAQNQPVDEINCSAKHGVKKTPSKLATTSDQVLPVISLGQVADHCTPQDAWMVIYDKVYDVTDFLTKHPGGEDVLLEYVGHDATIAFRSVGHSAGAVRLLERYCIGVLPADERLGYLPLECH